MRKTGEKQPKLFISLLTVPFGVLYNINMNFVQY